MSRIGISEKCVSARQCDQMLEFKVAQNFQNLPQQFFLKKMGRTRTLFVYFCSFQTQLLQKKKLAFGGIRTRIVGVIGKQADHLYTTMAPHSSILVKKKSCFKISKKYRSLNERTNKDKNYLSFNLDGKGGRHVLECLSSEVLINFGKQGGGLNPLLLTVTHTRTHDTKHS